jgi:hypothetical protein
LPAIRYDLLVEQGCDYTLTVPVLDDAGQPQTLAGWTVRGQIRAGYSSPTVLHTLALTLSGTAVTLRVPATASAAWTFSLGRYDVELEAPDGTVTRLVEGSVVVRPEITRIQ